MSGSVAQSLGIVTIIWGGTTINVESKSSSFSPGGYVSTPVINGNAISQAKQLMQPTVKASFALTKGMSLTGMRALDGTEMQIKCDSGQTYTIASAFLTKDFMTKAGPGSNVSAEWSGGAPAVESIA